MISEKLIWMATEYDFKSSYHHKTQLIFCLVVVACTSQSLATFES